MRSFQVFTVTLCLLAGSYLLVYAPPFFMPDRWDPSVGRQLDPLSARLLGAGLLAIAAAGAEFLRRRYYAAGEAPDLRWHYRHFALLVLALGLLGTALLRARPGPNPDHRGRAPTTLGTLPSPLPPGPGSTR